MLWVDSELLRNFISIRNLFLRKKSKMRKCHVCNDELKKVDDITMELDNHTFVVKGERCTNCGEEFIGEAEGQRMIELARKAGVWEYEDIES